MSEEGQRVRDGWERGRREEGKEKMMEMKGERHNKKQGKKDTGMSVGGK